MQERNVVIAGAGIGGAVLALLLARQGLRVTVLEQARSFSPIYRGEFLQPRSLEILEGLGLGEQIRALSAPVYESRLERKDGRIYGVVDYRRLQGSIREGRNGHHRAIQQTVLDALAAQPTADVRMGVRVTGVLRAGAADAAGSSGGVGSVIGLETTAGSFRAWLTVGADGQHSAVRKHLGIGAREFRYPGEPLAVTVDLDEDPPESVSFLFGTGESALFFPLPNHQARLYLVLSDGDFAIMKEHADGGLARLKERLASFFPQYERSIQQIPSMAVVQRVPCWYLRADRWVADGAALLGDAVHSVSPTRGQGMNLAIQDADALARLIPRLDRTRPPGRADLLPYERLRRRPADFIQRDADQIHRLLLVESPFMLKLRDVYLAALQRAPETMAQVLAMYAGTVRPRVWWDSPFVTSAVMFPPLDRWVARTWGPMLEPLRYEFEKD